MKNAKTLSPFTTYISEKRSEHKNLTNQIKRFYFGQRNLKLKGMSEKGIKRYIILLSILQFLVVFGVKYVFSPSHVKTHLVICLFNCLGGKFTKRLGC